MKLNRNCIRDILLTLEMFDLGTTCTVDSLSAAEHLKVYSKDEIAYSIQLLQEAQYINTTRSNINRMTWEGHLFLEEIRDGKAFEVQNDKVLEIKV